MRSLLETVCLALLLALALPHSVTARSEAKAIDVLPGAFGESIDTLDEATIGRCIEYADRAREALLGDFERVMEEMQQEGYLQILQTTLLLPGSLPPDATDTDRAIWAELYEGVACVVSFVTIDNSMNLSGVPYAEVSGRFGDYAVLPDGSVKSVSLRGIRGRFFADPVVPGVRVINMGSHYNTHYTLPASTDAHDAKPPDGDYVENVRVGELVYITVLENQSTPYRWVYQLSDDTMMECVYDKYTTDDHPPGMTGVGGKHRFRFEATAPGTCWIDFYLVLMGDDIEEAVQKITYVVIVKEAGVPLFDYLDDPTLTAFAMRFETDFPVSVSVRHDGEAGGIPVTVTDPATIRAVFEALRQITVLDEWPVSGHTDDYLNYYFEMADGTVMYGFLFQDGMLLDGGLGLREITGFDALPRALPDPGLH